jgi:rubredoxin
MKISDVFKCPECGDNRVEEIIDNAVTCSPVLEINDGGDTTYGEANISEGFTDRFQCIGCGFVLEGITNTEELFDHFNNPD